MIYFFAIVILFFLVVGIIAAIMSKTKNDGENQDGNNPPDNPQTNKKKSWISEQFKEGFWKTPLFMFVGLIALNFLIYHFFPSIWLYFEKSLGFDFWLLQVSLILIFWLCRKGEKKKPMEDLNGWGVTILFILFVGTLVTLWENGGEEKAEKLIPTVTYTPRRSTTSKPAFTSRFTSQSPLSPSTNVEGERETREFFEKKGLSSAEVDELAMIAHRESDFHQFESDGKTPLRGRENPHDIGRFQINEDFREQELALADTPKEVRSFDIRNTTGNMEYAYYLYRKYGVTPWNPSSATEMLKTISTKGLKTLTVRALVGSYSEPVDLKGKNWDIHESGNVLVIRNHRGKPIHDGPHKTIMYGNPDTLEFQSAEDHPVTVTFTFK